MKDSICCPNRNSRVKSGLVCKLPFGGQRVMAVRDFDQCLYGFWCHELLKSFGLNRALPVLWLVDQDQN